jgi:hypothetical protein
MKTHMDHSFGMAARRPMAQLVLLMSLSSGTSLASAGRDAGQIDMQDKANRAAAIVAGEQEMARKAQQFLPPDYGPHAVATAWSNRRLVKMRIDAERSRYASATAQKE